MSEQNQGMPNPEIPQSEYIPPVNEPPVIPPFQAERPFEQANQQSYQVPPASEQPSQAPYQQPYQQPYHQPYQQPYPPQGQYVPPSGFYGEPGLTADDKTWGGLSYIPIIGLIVLFLQDKASRPFIKKHAVQSVALCVVYVLAITLIGWIPIIGWIIAPLMSIAYVVYSIINIINALNGKDVNIPILTDFLHRQGWVK